VLSEIGGWVLPSFLETREAAERCYLTEALYWVALHRFPLAYITENGYDGREETAFIEQLAPAYELALVGGVECREAGLIPNPEWQALETGEHHLDPAFLQRRLANPNLRDRHEELRAQLEQSVQFHQAQADWNKKFDQFMDPHKARLFLALREGRVNAFGQRLPANTIKESTAQLEGSGWEGWPRAGWDLIPPDFWMHGGIDWLACHAEGYQGSYALILVDSNTLFEAFPIPTDGTPHTVIQVGDAFVFSDAEELENLPATRRGRRAYPWDQFHVEMTRRIMAAGGLPEKQEAIIAGMQQWCRTSWKVEVGRSTIFGKVKPYYDAMVRTSEIRG
jgi:hypothetical protein